MEQNKQKAVVFPPVVAVLGHVDHGKTTLLDTIRKSSIAKREFGGITQKIGTSSVLVPHEGKTRKITFIDTPGHAAFTKMRGRGATVSDIALLIVSAVEGVMPQTKESIQILQASEIPYIAVLTKADLPAKNIEKVKQELIRENVLLEGYGGDVPVIEVSAQTGLHITDLLDLILLVHDVHPKNNLSEENPLEAIVIEAKLDQRSGPKATVIVKNGHLAPRMDLRLEGKTFRVRSLLDESGKQIQYATVGDGIEVSGMADVPDVGSLMTLKDEALSSSGPVPVTALLQRELKYQIQEKEQGISLVLCADTEGSLEAITYALPEEVRIISRKTGEVSEADILLAKSTGSLVVSFNSKIRPDVLRLAQTEKVLAKNYQIIYEMLDEIKDVMEGKKLAEMEEIYGVAKVMAIFPFEKTKAFGIMVTDGRIAQRDKIRVMRGAENVGETTITSLRSGKNVVSKVEKSHEGGFLISSPLDIQMGDVILSHS